MRKTDYQYAWFHSWNRKYFRSHSSEGESYVQARTVGSSAELNHNWLRMWVVRQE